VTDSSAPPRSAPPTLGAASAGIAPCRRRAGARSPARSAGTASTPTTSSVLPLAWTAIAAYFHLSTGQAGLLTTITLLLSAVGGVPAGLLVDRIARVRTLMITVGGYAVFTMLCGFAANYQMLLAFRSLRRLGFGGELAAGANPGGRVCLGLVPGADGGPCSPRCWPPAFRAATTRSRPGCRRISRPSGI
jgi:hypothetical protein